MSKISDKELKLMKYKWAETERRVNYSNHLFKLKNNPEIAEAAKNELPCIELSFKEYNRLCKIEKEDYEKLRGRFALDPEERAEGERVYKNHIIWDWIRYGSIVFTLNVIMVDWEELMMPCLFITIIVLIIGSKIAGPPWFNLFMEK